MSTRIQVIIGLCLAALGGLVFIGLLAFTATGSVRDHIHDNYRLVRDEGRSREYTSPDPPSVVVAAIASRWKPADRLSDPSGHFLRYRDDYVVVSPDGAGGSRIHVDDEDEGYRRWYGHVGGSWGTYSGPSEGARGGGPGAGK